MAWLEFDELCKEGLARGSTIGFTHESPAQDMMNFNQGLVFAFSTREREGLARELLAI
jgi:hypothetical protein